MKPGQGQGQGQGLGQGQDHGQDHGRGQVLWSTWEKKRRSKVAMKKKKETNLRLKQEKKVAKGS